MLVKMLADYRAHLDGMADAWLAAGATALSIWSEGQLLLSWPADGVLEMHDLAEPVQVKQFVVGELRVHGLNDAASRKRLVADAALIACLCVQEDELEQMTAELIATQDQLLALYDISRSTRSQVGIDETLQLLAQETVRLVEAQVAFTLLTVWGDVRLVFYPTAVTDAAALRLLFEQVQATQCDLLLTAEAAAGRLPRGVFNLFLVPIRIRGTVLACIGLLNKPDGFASPHLKLVHAIAEQAGAQIENVLLYQETLAQARLQTEMELARQVQLRLLPQHQPDIYGIDVYGESRPSLHVGGDFFDFLLEPECPFLYAIGDVTGKGMPAALLMSITRTVLRSKVPLLAEISPSNIISLANEALYDDLTEVGMFVSIFVGCYCTDDSTLRYSNAGQAPVIYYPVGGTARLLTADGAAVGILPLSFATDQTLTLQPGDVLVVATDGFHEAFNTDGEMFGIERMVQLVEEHATLSARQLAHMLFHEVAVFASGQAQHDDQTLVVAKKIE